MKCCEGAKWLSNKTPPEICSTEWTGKSVWVTSPNTYLEFCHLSSSSTYFPKHNSDVWFHILASIQKKWLKNTADRRCEGKKKKKNTWHCNLWEQKVLQGISASLSWRSHTLLGNLTGSNLTIFYRMSLEGDGERQWISMSSISGWKPIIHPFNWYRLYTFLFVTIRGKWKLDEK